MYKKIIDKLNLSKSFQNVLKVVSGTMAGQLINFVALPVVTRMYGAKIMGIWTIVASITAIINAFSDMGITKAIMLEKDENLTDTYTVVSTISLTVSILSGIVFYIYFSLFPGDDGVPAIAMALMIAAYSCLLKQVDICYTILNRQQDYRVLMKNPTINHISMFIVAAALGALGFIKYGYYIGTIAGTFLTIVNMKSRLPQKTFTLDIRKYKKTIRNNKHYIIYQTPANTFEQVKNTLPTLLLKRMFGSTAVGYFSVSAKLLNAPVNLLGMSVGRVFFSELGKLKREGKEIKYFIDKSVNNAFRIAMLIFLVFFAVGDVFATVFLGQDWYIAGQMLRIMCFMSLFTFVSLSTQNVCVVINKQNYTVVYSVMQIITGVLSFAVLGYAYNNLLVSIAAYVISVVIVQMVYFCFIYKAVKLSIFRYLKNVFIGLLVIVLGTVVIRLIAMQFGIVNTIFF